jgi:hypothetical protein
MECHVSESGHYVRAVIGPGNTDEVVDCYRQIALLCAKHTVSRALVVSIDGDPTDHFAIEEAIRTLTLAGPPAGFKLAMASENAENYKVYSMAEAIAKRRQINAKAFQDVNAALQWLAE